MDSIVTALAGDPRQGKSHFSQAQAAARFRALGMCLVYNPSARDWLNYEVLEPMDIQDTQAYITSKHGKEAAKKYRQSRGIAFFRFRGQIWSVKDLRKVCDGAKVKVYRMTDEPSEKLFFEALFAYACCCLIVFDDFRAIVARTGLTKGLSSFCMAANHAGRRAGLGRVGVDVTFVYHHPDQINPEVWTGATDVVTFFFKKEFRNEKGNDADIIELFDRAKSELKTKSYQFLHLDTATGDVRKSKLKA